jgi:hypothetical protein
MTSNAETDKMQELRSDVISRALLQLNQPPAACLGVGHVLGHPRHANGVCDLLHLVVHAGRQVARLDVLVYMHLLRAARDDEDGNVTGLDDARRKDVDVPDVEDAAVALEAGGRVLLHECLVHLVLRRAEPELQRLRVALDVRVQHLGQDVLAHLLQEGLDLEARVHLTELLNHHGRLVLCEEAGHAVGYGARRRDQRVLGLGVH